MTQNNCTTKNAKAQGENWRVFLDDPEQLRTLVEGVVQEIIEVEFEEHIGVGPYERSAERRDYRNGYKPRKLKTRVGELELSIPQARYEAFRSQIFRRYQRSERAFLLTLQEMVIQGVSTRKVRKITEELCGVTFSKSLVSQLMTELDADIQAWLERSRPGGTISLFDCGCRIRENPRRP